MSPLWSIVIIALASGLAGCSSSHTQARTKANAVPQGGDPGDIDAALRAFQNRTIYRRLTLEVLAGIADRDLELAVMDFISEKAKAHGGDERAALDALSEGFLAVYATWWVEAEVNNGGFNQLFWNSAGAYAQDAVAGFTRFGAPEQAALTQRAIAIHNDQAARQELLQQRGTPEAFSESYEDNPLNDLDEEFYELQGRVNVGALRVKYIRENAALFVAE